MMRAVLPQSRAGFTMIELIVASAVIAILMALLLPAVIQVREASRRTQCQNNLHNLGIAMVSSANVQRRLPASGYITNKGATPVQSHNWVVDLLAYLDQTDIYNAWDFRQTLSDPPNQALTQLELRLLVCPTDVTAIGQGDLSYAVNGGLGFTSVVNGVGDCPVGGDGLQPLDFNGNGVVCPANVKLDGSPGDKQLFFELGLFFLENFPPSTDPRVTVRHHTLDDIVDGLSQTILIGENVRVGFDPSFPGANWASANANRSSFMVPPAVCANSTCAPGNVDYSRANRGAAAINSGLTLPEGVAFWPNSFHPGGVHFVFGDGHVKFISQSINGMAYARLLSPQGTRVRGPLAQAISGDADY